MNIDHDKIKRALARMDPAFRTSICRKYKGRGYLYVNVKNGDRRQLIYKTCPSCK